MPTIQFVSDLHLEFERREQDRLALAVSPDTDVLVLAGDVHNDLLGLDAFVRPLANQVPVVLVAGNHEFFTREINATYAYLADWAASIPDLHFLENDSIKLAGLNFIGATLWSSFDDGDAALMKKATGMMTDYAVIADRSAPRNRLTPQKLLDLHSRSVEFIETELRRCERANTVVVTHHAPSTRSTTAKGPDWDRLYGSNLEAMIEERGPALWIHGHVHESFDYTIGRTQVVCNPRGYARYGDNPAFDLARMVQIEAADRRLRRE